MGKAIIMRNCFKKIFNLVKHFSFNYIYTLLKTNLKEAELIAYWGFVIVVVNGLCYLILSYIFKNDGGAWLSNFGQSFGFASAILAFLSILLILKNIRDQNKDSHNLNTKQDQKLVTLRKQAIVTAQLTALDVFIKANRALITSYEGELKDNGQDSEDNYRLSAEIAKRKMFIQNTANEISEKANTVESDFVENEDPEKMQNNPAANHNMLSYANKVIQKIAGEESVPECAIISNNILRKLGDAMAGTENEKDRLNFLKSHNIFFAKWISAIFNESDPIDKNYNLIIKDIDHYYKVDRILPHLQEAYDEKRFKNIIRAVENEFKKNYSMKTKKYISNPFLHRKQISQFANGNISNELDSIDSIKNQEWEGLKGSGKKILSEMQCENKIHEIIFNALKESPKNLRDSATGASEAISGPANRVS
jgi:hypothetical protein